jgi:hypothetical protein
MHEFATRYRDLPKNVFATRFTKPFLLVVILKSNQKSPGTAAIDEVLARKTTSKGEKNKDPNVIVTYVAYLEKTKEAERGMPISVGRDSANDIVIYHRSVSRRHASICEDADSGTFYAVDVGSSYGTELDEKILAPNREYPLNDGSIIIFAESVRCTFLTSEKLYELIQEYREE